MSICAGDAGVGDGLREEGRQGGPRAAPVTPEGEGPGGFTNTQ